jgi:Flp pilus assembly protein TadD
LLLFFKKEVLACLVSHLITQATQLLAQGRTAEAIPKLREAARLQPDNSAVLHDLGLACLNCGLVAEAVAALQRAVATNPKFARGHMQLGVALEAARNQVAAIEAYRRAAELLPSLTEAVYRAANLLEAHGQGNEALALFRRGGASRPKTSLGRVCEARALMAAGQDAEALRVLRQAVAADAGNALAQDLLGTVLAEAGEFEAARGCFKRAIALAPALAGSYYDMSRCRRMEAGDAAEVAQMRAALMDPRLEPGGRQRVHLALGKAAADLGDYAEAMRQWGAADAVRRGIKRFDLAAFTARVESMIALFTPAFVAEAAAHGQDSAMPIVVLGMPRSGTTLVEQIFARHPDVAAGGELQFWTGRGAQWERAGCPISFIAEAGKDYMRALQAISPGAAHVTDKMPFNFVWAGLIHAAVPGAVIVHCRRTPIAVALSVHQTHFNPRLDFPTGGAELVAYYRAYERIMAHWRQVLPADRFVEVDYEALTAAPERAIRSLLGACGLPWNAACMHPEQHAGVVKTPSKWQTRQPIYGTSVEAWKSYTNWLGVLTDLI